MAPKRVGVLISGRGSNMMALMRAARGVFPARIACVISNRTEAAGLDFARAQGLPAHAIDHRAFGSREAFDAAVHRQLLADGADLVACAGFMRIMTAGLIEAWAGRMLNIHPSLLPLYKGLDTHARALADGVRIHGCTVHFVTPELDSGPIVAQAAVPVLSGDSPDSLAGRVLAAEHRLYPMALAMVASGHASLVDGRVRLARDGPADGALFSPQPR